MSCGEVVVGVGLSSAATADEVRQLVVAALEDHGLSFPPTAIATRSRFVDDARLDLGCGVIGIDDEELLAASQPVSRSVGIAARVAETAALLATRPGGRLLGPMHRSAHATAAVAVTETGRFPA
ncbi:MAG: cobalamin biosynthesis protein [Acidimicrobiales bacterium]